MGMASQLADAQPALAQQSIQHVNLRPDGYYTGTVEQVANIGAGQSRTYLGARMKIPH